MHKQAEQVREISVETRPERAPIGPFSSRVPLLKAREYPRKRLLSLPLLAAVLHVWSPLWVSLFHRLAVPPPAGQPMIPQTRPQAATAAAPLLSYPRPLSARRARWGIASASRESAPV